MIAKCCTRQIFKNVGVKLKDFFPIMQISTSTGLLPYHQCYFGLFNFISLQSESFLSSDQIEKKEHFARPPCYNFTVNKKLPYHDLSIFPNCITIYHSRTLKSLVSHISHKFVSTILRLQTVGNQKVVEVASNGIPSSAKIGQMIIFCMKIG